MSFTEYLASRSTYDSPQSAFTASALGDPGMLAITSWQALKLYLQAKGTRAAGLETARQVWKGYQAKLRNTGSEA